MRWSFYKRRMVRLLPPLFFLLVANVAIAVALNAWSRQELNSLLSVTFYYSNYYQASSKSLFCSNLSPGYEHLWSLSFEEQFYLLWPWIVIFFLTIRALTTDRHHRHSRNDRGDRHPSRVRLRRTSVLVLRISRDAGSRRRPAMGVPRCSLVGSGKEPTKLIRILIWPAALFLLACLPFTDLTGPFLYRGGFDAIDLSSAIVLLAIMGGTWSGRRFFEWKPLAKLGLIAYAFYLWHVTIFDEIARIDTGWNYELRVVVAFGWTLAMALISWFLLERPLQRWVHRTTPRSPKLASEATTRIRTLDAANEEPVDVKASNAGPPESETSELGAPFAPPSEPSAAGPIPPERRKRVTASTNAFSSALIPASARFRFEWTAIARISMVNEVTTNQSDRARDPTRSDATPAILDEPRHRAPRDGVGSWSGTLRHTRADDPLHRTGRDQLGPLLSP